MGSGLIDKQMVALILILCLVTPETLHLTTVERTMTIVKTATDEVGEEPRKPATSLNVIEMPSCVEITRYHRRLTKKLL